MNTQQGKARKRVYWTISDEKGRRIADGFTPDPMDDREALSWVMRGGPHDGKPPAIEPARVYRFSAGACAATARGDELERVDSAGTLDERRLVAERELSGAAAPHLFDDPVLIENLGSSHRLADRLQGIANAAIDLSEALAKTFDTSHLRPWTGAHSDNLCSRVICGDPATLELLGICRADIRVIHPLPGGRAVQVTLRPGPYSPPRFPYRCRVLSRLEDQSSVYLFEECLP